MGRKKKTQTDFSSDDHERLQKLEAESKLEASEDTFMEPSKKRKGFKKDGTPRAPWGSKTRGGKHVNPIGTEVSEGQSQADIEQTKKYIRPLMEMVSGVGVRLAETKDAAMGPNELEILTDTASACVNQYLPNVLGEHANLVVFTLTFSQWSLRVYMLRQARLAELRAELNGMPVEAKEPPQPTVN